jgi:hypothetical protein
MLIRYLDSQAIHEAIYILTLINIVGITLFLSVDLLVPRYLLDSTYSRRSIFLLSIKINSVFASFTFFVAAIGLAVEKSSLFNFLAVLLYVFSLSFLFTCRSLLGGANQFTKSFMLTSLDFLAGLGFLIGLIISGELYFWSIIGVIGLSRMIISVFWLIWMYEKDPMIKKLDSKIELIYSAKLIQTIINLAVVGAGLQLLNNLPILLVSQSSVPDVYLIQIVVLTQIVRGILGLLSGLVTKSNNHLYEINLKISSLSQKQIFISNVRITVIAFIILLAFFYWQGGYIVKMYTSQSVTFSMVVLIFILFNESLLYVFGILRLILISVRRIFVLNVVIGMTILTLLFAWMSFNQSNLGILYAVTISTLLGVVSLYFISFKRKASLIN